MLRNALLWLTCLSLCACQEARKPSPAVTASVGHSEAEHSHEEEGEVHFTPEQLKLAGVVTQPATMKHLQPRLELPAIVVADPDLEVKLTSRVAGILEAVDVRVGDPVRRGQTLARISSPEVARLKVEYQQQVVERELAASNLNRRVGLARLGDVTRRPFEEAQKELAEARTAVATAQAELDLNRQKLKRLESLLKNGIASQQQVDEVRAAVRQAEARLRQAHTDRTVAEQHLERESDIRRSGLQVDSEAFQARAEIRRREEAAASLRRALEAFGTDPDAAGGSISMLSPIDGVITDRPRTVGEQVQPGDAVLSILNPSRVWAWVDLPPNQVASVRLGIPVTLRLSGSAQAFSGRVTYVSPVADPETKKIRARVELPNPTGKLRPNMLAQVELGQGKPRNVLTVPNEAVVQMENQPVVYVQEEPGTFHRRLIVPGARSAERTEVRQGLSAGELIVVEGVKVVRSEDQRASSGEEEHHH